MPHTITWLDRLRIERAVWTLDQRLYDLPRRSRIANRREVRQNLLTAAGDIGVAEALHNLGNSRRLASEYRSAEFGDGPRHSWLAAALFAVTAQLAITWILAEAALAFADGITVANPRSTGSFNWSGIRYLQDTVTVTLVDGKRSFVGGAWTPACWAIWIGLTVLVGRLWRVRPVRKRHRENATAI